jgi:Txe/YoeB family toxin of Txe-Axe toxin-antitoxin module
MNSHAPVRNRLLPAQLSALGPPDDLHGWSSRHISGKHRLVYRVSGKGRQQRLEIVRCRYHY